MDYDTFNGVRMIPAECSRGCSDPDCPYTHTPGWFALLDPKREFNSRDEAVKYALSLGEYNDAKAGSRFTA